VSGEDGFIQAPDVGLVFKKEEGVGKGARAVFAAKALGEVGKALDSFSPVLLPKARGSLVMPALRVWAIGRTKGTFPM
jgi:hypothetical protein